MLKNRLQIAAIATVTSSLFWLSSGSHAQMNDKSVIDTGAIEGTISGDVLSFKGIPYAAPPVGNLRWRSPQPVKPWTRSTSSNYLWFGSDADRARQLYDPAGKLSTEQLAFRIAIDMTMHEPARFVARQMTAQKVPSWLYRFDYVTDFERPKMTSAPHAGELSYLFDQMDKRYDSSHLTNRDQVVAKTFHQYFVNFAKSGNPNGAGLPPWSKFDPAKFDIMMFDMEGRAMMQPDPWRERLALVERKMDAKAASSPDRSSLASTSWQLVKFQGGDDKILIPDDRAKYTIAFNADSSVNVRFDCNRGRGTWKSPSPNRLQFGALALTRAKCPPDSLHDRIVKDWGFVRSYIIKDGHLFLSLMADGGIYEFEPMRPAQPVTPK